MECVLHHQGMVLDRTIKYLALFHQTVAMQCHHPYTQRKITMATRAMDADHNHPVSDEHRMEVEVHLPLVV